MCKNDAVGEQSHSIGTVRELMPTGAYNILIKRRNIEVPLSMRLRTPRIATSITGVECKWGRRYK
jgi:ribosomal 30S subunit maturation factor RimM